MSKQNNSDKVKDPITEKIIGCCFRVHNGLGPGFSEKTYQNAMKLALKTDGLKYETEKHFPIMFDSKRIGSCKLDLIVESKVVVELKAVTGKMPVIFQYQLLSYLKASGLHRGLLINFGNKSCSIKRFVK